MSSEIARLLKQRGHLVTRQGTLQDILLPRWDGDPEVTKSFEVLLYNLMRHDEIRKSFRNWAFTGEFDNSANGRHMKAYLTLCDKFGGWGEDNPEARQQRYASTFEWYISELLVREFAARASGFSLRLKDAHPGDEFDCVALLDEGTVQVECKTGKNSIYNDVAKFARRDSEVGAVYSFYLFDRDYTFAREGEDLPKLSREQAMKMGILGICRVSVGSHKFFEIWAVPDERGQRYFLACSAFDRFEDRFRYMLRYLLESSSGPVAGIYRREPIFFYGHDVLGAVLESFKRPEGGDSVDA